MADWSEQEIENDFADLHGTVYFNEIIDERREAFQAWLAEDRRRNRAEALLEYSAALRSSRDNITTWYAVARDIDDWAENL